MQCLFASSLSSAPLLCRRGAAAASSFFVVSSSLRHSSSSSPPLGGDGQQQQTSTYSSSAPTPSSRAPQGAVDFLRARAARAVAEKRISNEAMASFTDLWEHMPAHMLKATEAQLSELSAIGVNTPEEFDRMTPHMQQRFGRCVSEASAYSLASNLQHLSESTEKSEQMAKGESTGDNYWVEAASFFSDAAIPSFLKDEVFEDMKRDRRVDDRFGVPLAEYVSEEDARETERIRKQLAEGARLEAEAAPSDEAASSASPLASSSSPSREGLSGEAERRRRGTADNIPSFD